MIVKNIAMNAYQNAMKAHSQATAKITGQSAKPKAADGGFSDLIASSVKKVNSMEQQKETMIQEFASGKNQNVHELMITLQKAGLAMQMTSTVRSKIMQSYQEIMRMPF